VRALGQSAGFPPGDALQGAHLWEIPFDDKLAPCQISSRATSRLDYGEGDKVISPMAIAMGASSRWVGSPRLVDGRAFAPMETAMFNPVQIVIDAFVEQLHEQYEQVYGVLEPGYPGIIGFIARLAMENIANSDAPYHDMNHTIMVTLVGQEILRGKHISEGGITPREWLHFIISLPCHDMCGEYAAVTEKVGTSAMTRVVS
jgi:hypothetical protein